MAYLPITQFAEDTAHITGDKGNEVFSVRKDTAVALADTDGDYQPLITDSTGKLHVNVGNSVAVTNAGTFATQATPVTQADTFMLGGVNVKEINAVTPLMGNGVTGTGSQRVTIASDNTAFSVNSTLTAETTKVIGTVNQGTSPWVTSNVTTSVVGNGLAATAQRVTLANDSTGVIATVGAVTAITNALPAGTNAIGKLAANTGVTIGAVEIAAAQTLATVTTVGTVTTLTGGGVAHDGVDSGNPVKVGAKANSSLAGATLVSSADRTDLVSDIDGAVIMRSHAPLGDLKSDAISNTDGASTASAVFTAVASTKNYITALHVFRTDAGTTPVYIDFRDGTAGAVLYRAVLPPNGGAVFPSGAVPYFKTSANTALAYDVSAAITTVFINTSGFQSKV